MTPIEHLFSRAMNQEELLFNVVAIVRPFITDIDLIDYAFFNLGAQEEVASEIWGLRQRSCDAIARLVARFSQDVPEVQWVDETVSILLPLLQDQFESRLRLLDAYWTRMKAQDYDTANPDLALIGDYITPLSKMLQECADIRAERGARVASYPRPKDTFAAA
jgi:hypothetical protein